jgi:hypothetical protein
MEDLRERSIAKKSLILGTNNKKHICETLRLICDEIYNIENNERIIELLIDAMVMAKKMQNRLAYYQKTYNDNTGNKAINVIGLTGVINRAKMRKARVL